MSDSLCNCRPGYVIDWLDDQFAGGHEWPAWEPFVDPGLSTA
jgi:enterochelin esterase-like enzyme